MTGVTYRESDGTTGELRADLTVACDGRSSTLRAAAGLPYREWPCPMDVWWFRVPRAEDDPASAVWVVGSARVALMFDRGDYWQCATLIGKGRDADLRRAPVESIMRSMADVVPWLSDRVDALRSWDDVKLLDVRVGRLERWYLDGLLCIGDAAHAMSPVGGVGINLAIQDAVAAARILGPRLRGGRVRRGRPARGATAPDRADGDDPAGAADRSSTGARARPGRPGRHVRSRRPAADPADRPPDPGRAQHRSVLHRQGRAARARAGLRPPGLMVSIRRTRSARAHSTWPPFARRARSGVT